MTKATPTLQKLKNKVYALFECAWCK